MSINYVSDDTGNTIAVQIPIEEWKQIKDKYPDVDDMDGELPLWQKKLIDRRLKAIADDPESIRPIEELFEELGKQDQSS